MSDKAEDFLASLDCPVEINFREPCEKTELTGLEEMAEVTQEQWDLLERRVMERHEKAREEYRVFMTAPPKPDRNYRNSVIVAAASSLLLVAILAGALLILMSRVN